jgi:hypothetical protein
MIKKVKKELKKKQSSKIFNAESSKLSDSFNQSDKDYSK